MSESRSFALGDVLSITTGCLVSRDPIDGVYRILNFMTGDDLFTHQLPRASEECRPHLLAQHPDLAEIEVPKWDNATKDEVYGWLDGIEATYGSTRDVTPLAAEDHTRIDPISELGLMGVGPERTIVAELPPEDAA
jgi:hypothetical protein